MKNRKFFLIWLATLLVSLLVSACGSLLEAAEQAVGAEYGPEYVPQEHQTRTLEAAFGHLKDNYIYYETADVDWDSVRAEYLARIETGLTDEQFTELMRSLEADLPPGALVYQSRSERIEADIADASTYEGIGAIVGFQEEEEPHVVILDVIDGSPAEQAGLQPHDSIYAIDGNPILLEEGLTVVNRIRGPAGSKVTLHVRTPGKSERAVEVTRGKLVSSGSLEARLLPGTDYGYLLFPPLSYQAMTQDVLESLKQFDADKKLDGLILDLRIAGSSRGWSLQDLLILFHDGEIGEYYNREGQTQPVSVQGEDYFGSQTVPLILLVGSNTSGSPEIFAASLQAGQRAVLVGEATPGALEVTEAFYLPDGARLFIETASFRLTDGAEIGIQGILPDVILDAGWDDIQPDADPVLEKAIELLDTLP